jgi:hypothetical protein
MKKSTKKQKSIFYMLNSGIFQIFISRFNKMNINYMVTGSVASMIYGEPRFTHDIDLIIEIDIKDIKKIFETFPENEFYCPPEEVIVIELKRPSRGHFNLIHHETGFKADVYPVGDEEFIEWALKNSREIKVETENIKIAPIEYVIIKKLEYFKEGLSNKHIEDISGMLKVSFEKIDKNLLNRFLKEKSLEKEFEICCRKTINK